MDGIGVCQNKVYVEPWKESCIGVNSNQNNEENLTDKQENQEDMDNQDDDDDDQINSNNEDVNNRLEKVSWSVGSWVLVEYDGNYYPGRVITKLETETEVECMSRSGPNWKWPARRDVAWYTKEQIIRQLNAPVPISSRGICVFENL
ncbi:uncharacterized protein LOC117102897 [Anneissia japonica]|uniref:uncharacterized protein LOC117102897 n=1 Tax=Anneissia japonica TaxID=1529436 RepID=UPI0014255344|nr:uncharacterized protein LOC117102897 [Anneissia japonica]